MRKRGHSPPFALCAGFALFQKSLDDFRPADQVGVILMMMLGTFTIFELVKNTRRL